VHSDAAHGRDWPAPEDKADDLLGIDSVSGYVGNFKVKIRQKARYVDFKTCTGCGACLEKCPGRTESQFERGLTKGKAIYRLLPQAVPNRPVIDPKACIYLTKASAVSAPRSARLVPSTMTTPTRSLRKK